MKSILLVTIIFLLSIVSFFYLYIPDIDLKGSKNILLDYGKKYKEEGYKATIFGIDVADRVNVSGNINYNKVGKYKLNYQIKNILGFKKSNYREIEIIDEDFPVIELVNGDVFLEVGKEYVDPGYKVFDNYDGDLADKVIVNSNLDVNKVGKYKIEYKVSDSSGNETIVVRDVVVTDPDVSSIPVFTYHHFMSDKEKYLYAPLDKYVMSTSAFEEQLVYLKNNGYSSVTLDDFYLWYIGKKILNKKNFVLTIDDGNISSYIYAIPLIEKYGFNATIFVITGRVKNEEKIWEPDKLKFFSDKIIEDIRNNHKSISLASHMHYLHSQINGSCAVASKSEDDIYEDIRISKEFIKSDYLAYPFGCHTDASSKAMKRAGFKMGFEFNDDKRATRKDDIYAIKRININTNVSMDKFKKWLEV